jgi:hypothetical protein
VSLVFRGEIADMEILKSGDEEIVSQAVSVLPESEMVVQKDCVSISSCFNAVG